MRGDAGVTSSRVAVEARYADIVERDARAARRPPGTDAIYVSVDIARRRKELGAWHRRD